MEEALAWLSEMEHEAAAAWGLQDLQSAGALGLSAAVSWFCSPTTDADMRRYVERLLTHSGYRVQAVVDGQAALVEARRRKPDLILSDVMMPRLDGFGLLAKLREEDSLQGVPSSCCRRGLVKKRKSKAYAPAPMTISSNPSRRASCWRAWKPISNWLGHARNPRALLREEAEILGTAQRGGYGAGRGNRPGAGRANRDRCGDASLSGAAFGSFFYNVIDDGGQILHPLHALGAPREAFSEFPMPRNTRGVRATFRGTGHRPFRRHHQGSALRQKRALSRACRPGICRSVVISRCRW